MRPLQISDRFKLVAYSFDYWANRQIGTIISVTYVDTGTVRFDAIYPDGETRAGSNHNSHPYVAELYEKAMCSKHF